MVEYKKGVGINFTDILKEKRIEKQETMAIPETLSGQEVADLFQKAYAELTLNIKEHLVDSNVILTTAGLKAQTEFFVDIKGEEDAAGVQVQVNKLNELFKILNPEIKFSMVKKSISPPRRGKRQMVSIQSLLGAERVSKISKIPGVIPFDKSTGWDGFVKWRSSIAKNFGALQETGTKPFVDDEAYTNVLAGLMKGYPDTAIYDFAEWFPTDRSKGMQDSEIPFTGLYSEAEPNYDFYPEHANNPDIKENIQQAGKILQQFYESDWHKQITQELQHHKRNDSWQVGGG
ncbi:MAG: hypothetical protein JNN11_02290 [Candidatus Doudnabacteria bacterium]|nr:hypothetical protein [Candidatus Doudnabacteria bacterium]